MSSHIILRRFIICWMIFGIAALLADSSLNLTAAKITGFIAGAAFVGAFTGFGKR